MKPKKKRFRLLKILLVLAIPLSLIFCNVAIENAAKGKTFTDVNEIPYNKVGLLLGTAKYLKSGVNLYYQYRINATVALWKKHKIKYIIISGDNKTVDYNEPVTMQKDLIAAGVDSAAIFLDYAGFRTFDSIVRLREIFSQNAATIISQKFHNERALYIASKEGIDAIAFNAKDVSEKAGLKTQAREKLARVKVFIDYLFGKKPKFLGDKVAIPFN